MPILTVFCSRVTFLPPRQITGSQAYATPTFGLNAANGLTRAEMRQSSGHMGRIVLRRKRETLPNHPGNHQQETLSVGGVFRGHSNQRIRMKLGILIATSEIGGISIGKPSSGFHSILGSGLSATTSMRAVCREQCLYCLRCTGRSRRDRRRDILLLAAIWTEHEGNLRFHFRSPCIHYINPIFKTSLKPGINKGDFAISLLIAKVKIVA